VIRKKYPMDIIAIIPAREGSTRFPGKLLANIEGRSLIRRVYEEAVKSKKLNEVIVATDDKKIETEVLSFGGRVVMASSGRNGTERCASAISQYMIKADYIINIQADTYIDHRQIDDLVRGLGDSSTIRTLIRKIESPATLQNPNIVKAVFSNQQKALYFSRAPIPYSGKVFWEHIGVYGYKRDVLLKVAELPAGKLEAIESLEQLRWLENGFEIKLCTTEYESMSVDVLEDAPKLEKFIRDQIRRTTND